MAHKSVSRKLHRSYQVPTPWSRYQMVPRRQLLQPLLRWPGIQVKSIIVPACGQLDSTAPKATDDSAAA